MSERPQGWTTVTLKELAGPNGMFTDGDWILSEHLKTGNEVRLIQLADVGAGQFLNKSKKFLSQSTAEKLGVTYLGENDVLISRMAHPLARACIFRGSSQPCITAVDVAVVRCDETVSLPAFIMHLCNSQNVLNQAEAIAVGTTRKRISRKNLERISVWLPPLNEQRRIVAKLEKLLSCVHAAQERLTTVPRVLKRFRQSILQSACSGALTRDWRKDYGIEDHPNSETEDQGKLPALPRSWRWAPLESLCEEVVDCPHSTPKWTSTGRVCIRTTNFKPGLLDLSEVRYVSDATYNERIARLRPEAGDVVYSREGGILGIACLIPPDLELCLGQRMMLFRLNGHFESRLLMHWLNSPFILRRVKELTGGSVSPHLNVRDIKDFPTPVPPVTEQQEIVRRVQALFKTADALEARYLKAKAHVDKLTQSILAKAFRGELVPQDPNDEPASVLLERITGERMDQPR